MAGAAHALNDDAGVLKCAECVEKSPVDQKGKSLLDFHMFIAKTVRASICDVVLSSTRQHDDQLSHQHENTVTRRSIIFVVAFLC